jgi:hypothetical protein
MHPPMRSWPMTDWDPDDREKTAYHPAGHAIVLWTFGVPPTGGAHLDHETQGGRTATELGAATRLSPRPPNRYVARRQKKVSGGSPCPLCGGGRRWRLRWPRGRRLRRPWRQHGATHSRWIRSSRTGTEVPSRIRRTIGSSASVIQGGNPRGRGGIIEDGGRPCPRGNRRTHQQILAAAK